MYYQISHDLFGHFLRNTSDRQPPVFHDTGTDTEDLYTSSRKQILRSRQPVLLSSDKRRLFTFADYMTPQSSDGSLSCILCLMQNMTTVAAKVICQLMCTWNINVICVYLLSYSHISGVHRFGHRLLNLTTNKCLHRQLSVLLFTCSELFPFSVLLLQTSSLH